MEHHVNIAPPTIGAGLAGKDHDFLLGPILVPRQSSQGDALEAVRFGRGLGPGADFLLYVEVSTALSFDYCLKRAGKLTRCLSFGQTP